MQPRPQRDAPSGRSESRRAASLVVPFHRRPRFRPHGESDRGPPSSDLGMSQNREEFIAYKRARFATRLPVPRRYTLSHFWLREEEPGVWLSGFTKFATRMLGEIVEYEFSVKAGEPVAIGQSIGWVEGFKAVSDIYSVVAGEFLGPNPALNQDITLVDSDPYNAGW